jgi:hypothetical protein
MSNPPNRISRPAEVPIAPPPSVVVVDPPSYGRVTALGPSHGTRGAGGGAHAMAHPYGPPGHVGCSEYRDNKWVGRGQLALAAVAITALVLSIISLYGGNLSLPSGYAITQMVVGVVALAILSVARFRIPFKGAPLGDKVLNLVIAFVAVAAIVAGAAALANHGGASLKFNATASYVTAIGSGLILALLIGNFAREERARYLMLMRDDEPSAAAAVGTGTPYVVPAGGYPIGVAYAGPDNPNSYPTQPQYGYGSSGARGVGSGGGPLPYSYPPQPHSAGGNLDASGGYAYAAAGAGGVGSGGPSRPTLYHAPYAPYAADGASRTVSIAGPAIAAGADSGNDDASVHRAPVPTSGAPTSSTPAPADSPHLP